MGPAEGDGTPRYASRAAAKLAHALDAFEIDVTGLRCADFGCHAGGFTDCLLRRGAACVYAVDTAYGVLDYRLRRDPRVTVMERTNALHAEPPAGGKVDLVTIDLGWTPQRHAIPAACRWLDVRHRDPSSHGQPALAHATPASGPGGRIISLVKPHYELEEDERATLLRAGALDPADAERVVRRVLDGLPALGVEPLAATRSPIRGAKSTRRGPGGGNVEYLVLARVC